MRLFLLLSQTPTAYFDVETLPPLRDDTELPEAPNSFAAELAHFLT